MTDSDSDKYQTAVTSAFRGETEPIERRPPKKGRLGAVLLMLAALAGAGYYMLGGKRATDTQSAAATGAKPAAGNTAAPGGAPAAPVEVTTAAAISRELPRGIEIVGSLAADEEVIVSAQIAGEVSALNVDFGSYVAQGQVIAEIDQRDAKLRVEQAEASLKQTLARLGMKDGDSFNPENNSDVRVARTQLDWSKLDLDRAASLVEKGDIARSQYDLTVTNHNAAKARYQVALDAVNQQLAVIEQQRSALSLARKALGDTVVRAPISGAVKEKHTARGAFLPVGGRLITLVRINPLRLRAEVPESHAAAVRIGQVISLTTEAHPDRTFQGRVARIGAALDERTRALTIEATVNNPGNVLRPGMFAKSNLTLQQRGAVTMVPQSAISRIAGLNKVYVIENNKAVERIVKTGVADGSLIEITEGIQSGEKVATNNLDKLQNGAVVSGR
ncbi:MAG: efflux RND transporter periplasmic adaptor subunit [Blastocatellia bacterium]